MFTVNPKEYLGSKTFEEQLTKERKTKRKKVKKPQQLATVSFIYIDN